MSEHLQLELDHLNAHPDKPMPDEPGEEGEGRKAVILVVDDDPDMRTYVRHCLRPIENSVHSVLEASDGQQALLLIGSHNIDLVIADVVMPVVDGIELQRQVREEAATDSPPFLFISGEELDWKGAGRPLKHVLRKPFNSQTLCESVQQILEQSTQPPQSKPSQS